MGVRLSVCVSEYDFLAVCTTATDVNAPLRVGDFDALQVVIPYFAVVRGDTDIIHSRRLVRDVDGYKLPQSSF